MPGIRVNNEHYQIYLDTLRQKISAAAPNAVDWIDLMATVRKTGVPVKNWLHVRSALQMLMDERVIRRIADVRVEEYELVINKTSFKGDV